MSNIVAMAVTAVAIVVGGYGLYGVAYKRGYASGYEDAAHQDTVSFTPE